MAGKAVAKGGAMKAKGKKRTKKDPNAPKRALSSYMFFAKDKREEIVKKNPSLKADISRVGKMIGEAWAKLSQADKAPFEKKAEADKARYEREITAYRKQN